jgi:transporter family-2 protein
MSFAIIIPFALGIVGILQGFLNKQMSMSIGVAHATLITCVITVMISAPFYFVVKYYPQYFPDFFHVKQNLTFFKGWYWIPGTFGFFIVAGLPFAFAKFGAVKVTVLLIAAQMMASVAWDVLIEKIPVVTQKVIGMILAFASVLLITLAK